MRNRWIVLLTIFFIALGAPGVEAITLATLTHAAGPVTNNTASSVTTNVQVSDDFSIPLGNVFARYFADADLTGAGSVVLNGYIDTTNTPFGTEILLGSANDSTVPFASAEIPLTLSAPFVLTLTATITLEPGASLSFTHSLVVSDTATAVSGPATGLLLVLALAMAGVVRSWGRTRMADITS